MARQDHIVTKSTRVFELAAFGCNRSEIAQRYGLKRQTFLSRLKTDQALAEAYYSGRELFFKDLLKAGELQRADFILRLAELKTEREELEKTPASKIAPAQNIAVPFSCAVCSEAVSCAVKIDRRKRSKNRSKQSPQK